MNTETLEKIFNGGQHVPISENDLIAFEQKIGMPLPQSYKQFMLKFNGNSPTPLKYLVIMADGEAFVNTLYGFKLPGSRNIEQAYDGLQHSGSEGILPIASDGGDGSYYLDLNTGGVFFLEHYRDKDVSSFKNFDMFLDAISEYKP